MTLTAQKLTADTDVCRHYDQYPFYLNDEVVLEKILQETILGDLIRNKRMAGFEKIADLGCGALAKNVSLLQKYSPELQDKTIIGTDISWQSLTLAKSHHQKAYFLQTDNYQLPFRDDAFDFIMATGTMHHMVFPERGITEALRVLKHHKQLYLSLYNRSNFYYWIYRMAKLLRWLEKKGLQKVIKYIFVPLYGVLYWLANLAATKKLRKISYREMEMDFYDKLMVPIAHFFTISDVKRIVEPDGRIVRYNYYAGGMMMGILIQKERAHL